MKAMNIALDHILMTQRNCLEFDFELILEKQQIINRKKYEWETFNTSKIKTVYMHFGIKTDYGTKLRIKCHQRIKRNEKTIGGELCTNWEMIDKLGVRLDHDGSVYHTDGYENFYDNPRDWIQSGNGL